MRAPHRGNGRTSRRPEWRPALHAAAIAAALIAGVACGRGEDPDDPATDEASARVASGTDATAASDATECTLPDPFPPETPVVPECFHVGDVSSGSFTALVLSTTLSPEEALAYLEKELPATGWTIEGRETYEDGVVSLSASGHGIEATIEVQPRSSSDDETIGVNYLIM